MNEHPHETGRLATPTPRVADHLANERTALAWVRTSLGLIGIGFVLARMSLFLQQFAVINLPTAPGTVGGSHEFLITGIVFLLLGTTICLGSGWLYHRNRLDIESGHYKPATKTITALTLIVGCGTLVVTGLLIWQFRF